MAVVKAIAPGFGGHQPRGHLGAAVLRDRVPAAGRARHPGVPRRPARDRGGRAGGAAQRADVDRAADRRHPGRDRGAGRRRRGGDRHPARPPGVRHIIGCDSRGAVHTEREDYLDGTMSPVKRALAQRTNLERRSGGPADVIEGADLFIGLSGGAGPARLGPGQDEPRPDRVRDGQPGPRGLARGGAALRADPGHRPLGLSQPDQQRALLPGDLPRRAGRPRRRTSPRR